MNEPKIYHFSEKSIREIKKRYLVIQILLPVFLLIFLLASPSTGSFFTKQPLTTYFKAGLIAIFIFETELFIVSRIMLKKMKELSVMLLDEYIVRSSGKLSEKIPFDKISNLIITEKPSEEILYLNVKFGKKSFLVHGLDELDEISNRIQNKISKNIVQRKKQKINWSSPIAIIGIMAVTLLIIFIIQALGPTSYFTFNFVFIFSVSLGLLIYKPISKSNGKRFEMFEILMASLMMLISLCMLLGILLPSIIINFSN